MRDCYYKATWVGKLTGYEHMVVGDVGEKMVVE